MGFMCRTDTTNCCKVTTHVRGRKIIHTKDFPLMDHMPHHLRNIPKVHGILFLKLLIYLEIKLPILIQLLQWEIPGIRSYPSFLQKEAHMTEQLGMQSGIFKFKTYTNQLMPECHGHPLARDSAKVSSHGERILCASYP